MEKNLTSEFLLKLKDYAAKGWIDQKITHALRQFYESYKETLEEHGLSMEPSLPCFFNFLEFLKEQHNNPYTFEPYHAQIREPFDYYAFGLEFLRPLVDLSISSLHGEGHVREILAHLEKGHNVILLANHQTEADPLAISILLEKIAPKLGAEMIFVAGERVVTDPLAVPFSMGRNLLCIYSKRYIDHPPEDKLKKQMHNKKTMELMSSLLKEGGKCIYVAPSGGRDRRNKEGVIEVAPFDPQSIEMFYLMARKASHPTFFYPMALATYDLLPPPETIQVELGEERKTTHGGIHVAFGPVIDMENFPGSENPDKHLRRKARADYIWDQVNSDYQKFAT